MAPSARGNALTVILMILVVIMGAEIVYLITQNRYLQSLLAEAPQLQVLQKGQAVPPVTATDLDGDDASLRYGAGAPSTVLIWFSPSCHLCAENTLFWNDLYDRYKASPQLRFLAMSDSDAEETRNYVADHALQVPVLSVTDDRLIDAYNGHVMPQTALISPRGDVKRIWPGALEEFRQDEITAALDSLTDHVTLNPSGRR
jgi:peroxiredoxin